MAGTPPLPHYVNADHALATGMFIGALMKAGIQVVPEVDPEGNYLPILNVTIRLEELEQIVLRIFVSWPEED